MELMAARARAGLACWQLGLVVFFVWLFATMASMASGQHLAKLVTPLVFGGTLCFCYFTGLVGAILTASSSPVGRDSAIFMGFICSWPFLTMASTVPYGRELPSSSILCIFAVATVFMAYFREVEVYYRSKEIAWAQKRMVPPILAIVPAIISLLVYMQHASTQARIVLIISVTACCMLPLFMFSALQMIRTANFESASAEASAPSL